MEFRILTTTEQELIRRNISMLERRSQLWDRKCDQCLYPMLEFDSHYMAIGIGAVCNVCEAIYKSVAYKSYWMNLHTEWLNSSKNNGNSTSA